MLAGVRPYSANTAYEWIILHMNATPPNLADYGVGPQLARVVKRMLAGRPELRQQTMREVMQDLRTAARGLKSVHAFSAEGTAIAAGSGLTTDISAAPAAVPSPIPAVPTGVPASPPTASYQPPPAATPQPSHQSQPQPSYQQPGYPNQAAYQNPPTPYPQQGSAYGSGAMAPSPPYQPAYPGQYQPGPTDPGRPSRLRRLAEFSFGALIIVVYLIFNWGETVAFFHRFLDSLKFKGGG
jgi:hypothetical protein